MVVGIPSGTELPAPTKNTIGCPDITELTKLSNDDLSLERLKRTATYMERSHNSPFLVEYLKGLAEYSPDGVGPRSNLPESQGAS